MLIFQLNAAKELYQVLQHTKFQYEHCWNLLKYSPKWLAICNNQQPKKRGRSEASSPFNIESISLEDDDIPQVPIVSLERHLGLKAEKERLKNKSPEKARLACSLPSAGDRSNIILGVPRSNHKEQGKRQYN